ncbi:MAG: hypothetical protein H0V44_05485 [Planctomycetes bacterium]|nr:hypothetical protein [Planctomycetota bacterium]
MRRDVVAAAAIALIVVQMAGCGGAVPRVSSGMVASARERWPDASEASLGRGRDLYTRRCNTCHALPLPGEHPAEEWPAIVRSMGKRSKLDSAAQDDVARFLMVARQP